MNRGKQLDNYEHPHETQKHLNATFVSRLSAPANQSKRWKSNPLVPFSDLNAQLPSKQEPSHQKKQEAIQTIQTDNYEILKSPLFTLSIYKLLELKDRTEPFWFPSPLEVYGSVCDLNSKLWMQRGPMIHTFMIRDDTSPKDLKVEYWEQPNMPVKIVFGATYRCVGRFDRSENVLRCFWFSRVEAKEEIQFSRVLLSIIDKRLRAIED
eukprot:TRINITY_DN6859_c0_g1_i1.p1 TRINITY_DN6859_c0_g1~~TRINITY_DN6859_c0_g1_i1.p1  ORF type:complete len:209 (+),score=31.68 TRINITY_DN6859_c0_g1_i1:82-708(+)